MEKEEVLNWAKSQDVVKVSCVKVNETDKFILTVGQYEVLPLKFDSQKEAQEFLEENFKFTNFDLAIIGAMCQRINELNELEKLNPKNKEK